MLLELVRLVLGLILAMFHRPVSDFILEQDRALAGLVRSRGIPIPAPLTTETSRTLFFLLGIGVALAQIARIYLIYLQK